MQVRLLGPVELTGRGGRPVAVGGPKERALLAVLAVHANHVLSEDRLVDALWGDRPPRTAARTLQSYLSRLRGALAEAGADGVLESHSGGWSLSLSADNFDVAAIDELVVAGRKAMEDGDHLGAALSFGDALRAWRGRPLEEFGDLAWAVLEAGRLDELRALITEQRIDAELACGRHAEVIGPLEAVCRDHPLRERAWAQRMLALYRAGRQAEALRVYQQLRATLTEELGIEPSPAVARLEQAILTHDPSLEWSSAPASAHEPTASAPVLRAVPDVAPAAPAAPGAEVDGERPPLPASLLALRSHAFVGREREIAELDAAWGRARAAQREVVLIAGEPGIGKTTLAVHVSVEAWNDGATVLFGRCDEESVVPFQPFVEALTHYVDTTPPDELRQRLGAQAQDLALLVPGVARRLPEVADIQRTGAETERYRMFEAVAALVGSLGSATALVLVLDDLHWADRPTLQLLQHLIRRTSDAAVLVIGTYRDTDLVRTHPMAETLAELRRANLVARVPLRGLELDDVRSLVTGGQPAERGDEELAAALWHETEGSPLFLREILRHLDETGAIARDDDGRWLARRRIDQLGIPEGVKEVIGRRLTRLSEDANTALRTGSIIGREIRLDVLERITDLNADALLDALDEATAAGVVDERAGGVGRWAFTHALVRQALYDELSLTRRVRLHQRVGEALEELEPGDGPQLAELAFHFSQAAVAGAAAKAIDYARRAGAYALRLAAYEEAARHFAMAHEVAEDAGLDAVFRAELLLAQGDAEMRAGDFRVARATFERVVAIAGDDADTLARAALGYAGAGVRPIWVEVWIVNERTVGLLEQALAALEPGDGELRAKVMACLAQELHFDALAEARRDALSADAMAMARRLGDPRTLAFALSARDLAVAGPRARTEAVANASEMLDISRLLGDRQLEAVALRHRMIGHSQSGDWAAATADLEAWAALVSELKDPLDEGFTKQLRGAAAIHEGRLEEAEALLMEAFRIAQEARDRNAFGSFVTSLGTLRFLQGRAEEILASGDAVIQTYPRAAGFFDAAVAGMFAELGIDEGEALARMNRVDPDDAVQFPHNIFWSVGMAFFARGCYRLGEAKKAESAYRLLLPLAGSLAGFATIGVGAIDTYIALAAAAAGDPDAAGRHFEDGLEVNRRNGWRPWVADTQAMYAHFLAHRDAAGNRERAMELLDAALETAAELGLGGVKANCEEVRAQLDGTAPAPRPRGERLTRRDRARSKLTLTARAAVARWTRGDSDEELVRRFASATAQRAVFATMARSFQPSMAFGFSGDLVFELLAPDDEVDPAAADWWTIEVRGRKASARRGRSDAAAATIHARLSDFIRLSSGELHAVNALIDNRVEVDGDILLAARIPEMFGFVEPIELGAPAGA